MSRSLILAIAILGITAVTGCKKDIPTQAAPIVADDSTNGPPQTQKSGDLASQREATVNMSPYMIRGEMNLPEVYRIVRRLGSGSCFIDGGKGFSIEIEKAIAPLAATKEHWSSLNPRWIKDEPNVLLAELPGIAPGMYAFEARITLGDETFRLQSPIAIPITSEQAERMLRAALSLKQTDAIKESIKREPEAIASLRAAGCTFLDEPLRRLLRVVGDRVTDDSLAHVDDIAGLSVIEVQPAPRLTANGIARLASLRGVDILRLGEITDGVAVPFKNMKDVRELAVDAKRLTDAGFAFAAALTDLQTLEVRATSDERGTSKFNGAGFSYLKGLQKLSSVNIFGATIDDTALENLGEIHSLRTLVISAAQITDDGLRHLERLKNLEELTLNDMAIRGNGLAAASELPKLKKINLDGCSISDAGVGQLRGAAVEELHLGQTLVGDNGLKVMPDLPALRSLDLHGTKVTDAGLAHLGRVRALVELNLSGTEVTGPGLVHLKAKPEFEILILNDSLVTDAALAELSGCPNLSHLGLDETGVTDAGLDKLQSVKALRTVSVAGTEVTKAGVDRLKAAVKGIAVEWTSPAAEPDPKLVTPPIALDKLPPADPAAIVKKYDGQIKTDDSAKDKPVIAVSLENKAVTDEEIANLRAWKSIRMLNLKNCDKITDAALPYIAQLTELTELNLSGTAIKGDGLVHLKGLLDLTSLELPDARMSVKQVTPLSGLKELDHFRVSLPLDTNPALKFLCGFPKLRDIDLLEFKITNRQMAQIARLHGLERLTVVSDRFGDRGLSYVKDLKKLQELRLFGTAISDAGMKSLGEMIGLKVLELSGNRLTDNGLVNLRLLTELERLKITKTAFTDRTLQYIHDCSKLIELELPGANITDKGLSYLAEMKFIEWIDLSGTRVTDAGLKHFQSWEELRKLTMMDTAITGTGLIGLKKLKRLSRIELNRSRVSDAGLEAIAQLREPDDLYLWLDGTSITDAGLVNLKFAQNIREISLNGVTGLTDNAADILKAYPGLGEVWLRGSSLSPKAMAELKKKEGLTVHAD
jgi:Leucine-rich repeat (LRR) protein